MTTLQTVLMVLGPLVAATGWYVAANENYKKNRALEEQRQERERRGVVRQINLLLRVVIKNLTPFFYVYTNLQLNDVLATWNKLTDLLHDRASAIALTDEDYLALEAFWSRFGKMIAMAQDEARKWEAGGENAREYPSTPEERRLYLGQLFSDPLGLLEQAVNALGDEDVRRDFAELQGHAEIFMETMTQRAELRWQRKL
jgi:hypothetical protein